MTPRPSSSLFCCSSLQSPFTSVLRCYYPNSPLVLLLFMFISSDFSFSYSFMFLSAMVDATPSCISRRIRSTSSLSSPKLASCPFAVFLSVSFYSSFFYSLFLSASFDSTPSRISLRICSTSSLSSPKLASCNVAASVFPLILPSIDHA